VNKSFSPCFHPPSFRKLFAIFSCGPYHKEDERDNTAKEIRQRQQEDDGLFWADIDEAVILAVGTYTASFFWQESREDVN